MTKCLINECEKEMRTRGLCGRCYGSARNLIKAKQTTWEDLEKKNLILPKYKTFRKRTGLFTKQFYDINPLKEE